MNTITCQVTSVSNLTENAYKVLLKPDTKVSFEAGQYLQVVMAEDDKRPFSIASSPNNELLELQIGAFKADSYPMQVLDLIKRQQQITVEIPLGQAYLRQDRARPILLVAGGTGFSYIKSIFEYLSQVQFNQTVHVYWGVRDESACYELEQTQQLIASMANATFTPVLENPQQKWQGATGYVHHKVMQDIDNLSDFDIYLAGPFNMIPIVRDDFIAQGVSIDNMFSDAFAFL